MSGIWEEVLIRFYIYLNIATIATLHPFMTGTVYVTATIG
jgi:hypothetical protein